MRVSQSVDGTKPRQPAVPPRSTTPKRPAPCRRSNKRYASFPGQLGRRESAGRPSFQKLDALDAFFALRARRPWATIRPSIEAASQIDRLDPRPREVPRQPLRLSEFRSSKSRQLGRGRDQQVRSETPPAPGRVVRASRAKCPRASPPSGSDCTPTSAPTQAR